MHEIESSRQSEKDVYKGLWVYVLTLFVLTAIAWSVVVIRGSILHKPYPSNTLFFKPEYRFSDFSEEIARVAFFHQPHMLSRPDVPGYPDPFPYPAASVYAFLAFNYLPPTPLKAYLAFVVLAFFGTAWFYSFRIRRVSPKWLPQVAIWSTLLLGFPLQLLIDRGNIEAVIWVLILFGAFAYTRNRTLTSAILWSIAASMKIFPGLLFALFLARRKFGLFVVAIAMTAAFSVLALAGIGPTIDQAAADSSKSAPFQLDRFILIRHTPGFDHSLFQATKQVIFINAWRHRSGNDQLAPDTKAANKRALRIYNIVVPLGAFLLYWLRLRHMPLLNQFMAYILLCVLSPYFSADYTLVHVYLVWGAFLLFLLTDVTTGRIRIPAPTIYVMFLSCAVAFAPLTYLQIENKAGRILPFGAQVKTIFLLLLLVTVLRVRMPSSLFGDLQTLPSNSLPESA